MVQRGARKLVLMSRPGSAKRPEIVALVHDLQSQGATVQVYEGSVEVEEDVASAIATSNRIGVLRGIIQAANNLKVSTTHPLSSTSSLQHSAAP